MGHSLHPRNKQLRGFLWNIWGWEGLMKRPGFGGLIGVSDLDDETGRYKYYPRKGVSPMNNDGFYVYAKETRQMADDVEVWATKLMNKRPKLTLFVEWLRKCRGFWIY